MKLAFTSTTTYIDMFQTPSGYAGGITAGSVYTLSYYVKITGATDPYFGDVYYQFFNSAGTGLSGGWTAFGFGGVTPNTWTRRSITLTAPANAASLALYVSSGQSAGTNVYLDGFLVEQNSRALSYFDGSTSGASWTGTPNNSTSTMVVPDPVPVPAPTDPTIYWQAFDGAALPSKFQVISGSVTVGTNDGPDSVTTVDGRTGNPNSYMQIGAAGNNRNDQVSMSVTLANAGTVEFWRRAESEQGYDFCTFAIDGAQQYSVSGTNDWAKMSYQLAAGTHTLLWTYTADSGVNLGIDAQRITALTITGVAPVQVVASSPTTSWNVTGSVNASLTTSWTVAAGVTATQSTSWGVSGFISSALNTTWGVGGWVTGSMGTSWGVNTSVTASSGSTTWIEYGPVTTSLHTSWTLPGPPPLTVNDMVLVEVQQDDGTWANITGPSVTISLARADADVGTLSAELADVTLDPTVSNTLRFGRPIRVSAKQGSGWYVIYTGQILTIDTAYKPLTKYKIDINLTAQDNVATIANRSESRGVASITSLRWLLSGTGIPFVINGSSATLGAQAIAATNDNATLWDQVLITRDSNLGFAWVDRLNQLQVWDRSQFSQVSKDTLDTTVYSDIELDFNADQLINSVMVNYQRYDIGTETTTEVPYGPYEDGASIDQWGRYAATISLSGVTEDPTAIQAYGNQVLSLNSTGQVRAKSVTIPIKNDASLVHAYRDVDDVVTVVYPDGTSHTFRIIAISHELTSDKWSVTYSFDLPTSLNIPTNKPSTGISVIPPGSVTITQLGSDVTDQINSVQATANGKNTVHYATYDPGTTANTAGDIWFTYTGSTVTKQWKGNGGTSWSQVTITDTVIANIDAGKITSGLISADRINTAQLVIGSNITGFAANYDPSTKETPSGAQTKANNAQTYAQNYADSNYSGTKSTVSNWTYSGTTYINGGMIRTGTVIADSIRAGAIDGQTISGVTMTGSVFATGYQGSGPRVVINGKSVSFHNNVDYATGSIYSGTSADLYLDCSYGRLFVSANGALNLDGSGVWSNTILNTTNTASANVFIGGGGQLQKGTSVRAAKLAIEPLSADTVRRLLGVPVSSWFDRGNAERYAAHQQALASGEDQAITDELLCAVDPLVRIPGVVAEDVFEAAPLFATVDDQGKPTGVAYDRIGVAWIPLVKELFDRIEKLEGATNG